MTAVHTILDRVNRPKQTRPGQWIAACPCCESRRGRPLSIREADDGRVLVHAFCGCRTEDVLAKLGLELGDLFDQPTVPSVKPVHSKVPAADVLDALCVEVNVLAGIASDLLDKKELTQVTWDRLALAAYRLTNASNYLNERNT